jgi:hypothetical protein
MNKSNLLFLAFLIFTTHVGAQVVSRAHRARENKYDVTFYFLDLNLESNSNVVSGNVLIRAKSVTSNLDTFAVELASNFTIDSVKTKVQTGLFQTAQFARSGREVNVLMPVSAQSDQLIETRIYYRGTAQASNGQFGTIYTGFFAGTGHKFSASPPYNANTWFPCKQVLSDKADSSWFFITTSASKAVSNGILSNVITLGNGKKRFEWKSSQSIAYYLVAFCVGSFSETTDYWKPTNRIDSLELKYYSWTFSGNRIQKILTIYSDLFGLYPFYNQKLSLMNVSLGGGIENQTMILMGNNVEVHEIAHQWWGDNVTCGSWKDVMLNEGFATWCESVFDEFNSPVNANQARMSHFTDNTSTTPVYGVNMDTTDVNGVFGNQSIYYDKASMVINSLRFHINNDSLFFQGLKNYQQEFGGKTALGSELKSVMEATSGIALTDFFNQWYYKGGAPTFNIAWNQINNELMLRITETTNSVANPLFKTPVELKVQRTQGDTIIRLFIGSTLSYFQLNCPGNITGFIVDPNQWITNGTGAVSKDVSLDIFSTSIEGNRYVCSNEASSLIYSSTQTNGHSYTWALTGGSLINGQGTSQVQISIDADSALLKVKECNASGNYCDSLVYTIQVSPAYSSIDTVSISSGDSLFIGNAWQTETGLYSDQFTTSQNCDSILSTYLIVDDPNFIFKSSFRQNFVLFPIPASESFSINGNLINGILEIYTISGTKCLELQAYKTNTPVDVSHLCDGVYFLSLIDSGNSNILQMKFLKHSN